MALWYYTRGSERLGPVDEAELRARIEKGEITPNTWIWRQGFNNWVKVSDWLQGGAAAGHFLAGGDAEARGPSGNPSGGHERVGVPTGDDLEVVSAVAESMAPVRELYQRITREIRKIFVGQDELILGTLTALFSGGHVLIESVPGLGKTLFVRTLGRVLGCKFNRIQFTADLMPSDITGSPIFDMKTQEFIFRPGPVFTNILLADEINRSPAKTHAALLEVMQEYSVTIERTRHKLDRPFLVLATQNPIESEGTYNLPEAQMDRFMFKLVMDYPLEQEEAQILIMHSVRQDIDHRLEELEVVTNPQEILEITQRAGEVCVDPKLVNYINSLVRKTRNWPQILIGASPRGGLALMQGARTLAAFRGRDFAVPDDVVDLALPALRHRVILVPEAEVEGYRVDDVLREVIRSVEVPRL
ncbi:MAG: AAA family ATPase [Thermogutta sp.]